MRLSLILGLLLNAVNLIAQQNFKPLKFVPDNLQPFTQATADFDGNGNTDIAYTTRSGALIILYNNTEFNFDSIYLRKGGKELAIGDLNKDGKADILSFDGGDENDHIEILFNKNGRVFDKTEISIPHVEHYSVFLKVIDFDGDTNPDIILSRGGESPLLYKGDGTGAFTLENLNSIYSDGKYLQVDDFNKDGLLDFISTNAVGDKLKIWLQSTERSFATPNQIDLVGQVVATSSADFSGDGYTDFMVSLYFNSNGITSSKLSYFKNDGAGQFLPAVVIPTVNQNLMSLTKADCNNDGHEDLVIGALTKQNAVSILKNNGNDNFEEQSITQSSSTFAFNLTAADLNNNGSVEIIELSPSKYINIYKRTDDQYLLAKRIITGILANVGCVTDLNNDGIMDVVAGSLNESVAVSYGLGDFKFNQPSFFSVNGPIYGIITGDYNGDGFADIVYATNSFSASPSEVGLLLSSQNGKLQPPITISTDPNYALAAADWNNDGKLDFICDSGVFLGDGTGGFEKKDFKSPAYFLSIESGNFNGDDFPDLAAYDGTKIHISINDGTGNFDLFNTFTSPNTFTRIKAGRFDSDKFTDLISINTYNQNSFSILRSKGDGTFEEKKITIDNSIQLFGSADMADFNNDNLTDIVLGVSQGGPQVGTVVLTQDEQGDFEVSIANTSVTFSLDYTIPELVLAKDMNGDYQMDIVSFTPSGLPILIYPNDLVVDPASVRAILATNDLPLDLFAYPNPADELLTIPLKNEEIPQRVELTNVHGQHFSVTYRIFEKSMLISTSGLQSGLYFVRFESNQMPSIIKFVKR